MQKLGDPHNFGKFVHLMEDGRIQKPRCIFWEKLLLDEGSDLRQKISELLSKNEGMEVKFLLPSLHFDADATSDVDYGGIVSRLISRPIERANLNEDILINIGATVSLLCWLGISDLHRDNIVFGEDENGNTVFSPVDVESIFHDFSLPSQTLLLPSQQCPLHMCGLSSLLSYFDGAPHPDLVLRICEGYVASMLFLSKYSNEIESTILAQPHIAQMPIRLFIRATREYHHSGYLSGKELLLDSEIEQLERGDIPYYFRIFSDDKLYSYGTDLKKIEQFLDADFKTYILNFSRIPGSHSFSHKNTDTLVKAGVLQIIKTLLPNWTGKIHRASTFLGSTESYLHFKYDTEINVQCKKI